MRLWTYLYNTRIDHPQEDIIAVADDTSRAFRQLKYHPDMAPLFASTLDEYLIIPVGLIFGAKDSPSWYMLSAEIRAHIARTFDFQTITTKLSNQLELPPKLSKRDRRKLLKHATKDSLNQGISSFLATVNKPYFSPHLPFVDDTGNLGFRDTIRNIVRDSVLAAYIMFGFPAEDMARPPINETKWIRHISHRLKYLGLIIDTRNLTIEWPLDKRESLYNLLTTTFAFKSTGPPSAKALPCTPKTAAQILGLLRNGTQISPFGAYFALTLQYCLTDKLRASQSNSSSRRWWSYTKLWIPNHVLLTLHVLWTTLLRSKWAHVWKRSLGLLIPRDPTAEPNQDASYEGIGGWGNKTLNYMWRVLRNELLLCGFNPGPNGNKNEHHINKMEFVALIVNIWVAIKHLYKLWRTNPQAYHEIILKMWADNTSALSWLLHAARVSDKPQRALALFCYALLTYCNFPHFSLQGGHIPGKDNTVSDTLSRINDLEDPSLPPQTTWDSVINKHSPTLDNLTPYLIPQKLLFRLSSCLTSGNPGDLSEQTMTNLWRLELRNSPPGWRHSASPTNTSPS
jgi:hypothetical protein